MTSMRVVTVVAWLVKRVMLVRVERRRGEREKNKGRTTEEDRGRRWDAGEKRT